MPHLLIAYAIYSLEVSYLFITEAQCKPMKKLDFSSLSRSHRTFSINIIIIICILIPLFLVPSSPSEEKLDTGWDGVPIETDYDLNDVITINATSAIAIGGSGKIFYTENSGNNWFEENSGTIKDLNSIEFVKVPIIVGDSGIVLVKEGNIWFDNSIMGASNLYDVSVVNYQSLNDSLVFVSGMDGEVWKWYNNSWIDLFSRLCHQAK